MDSLSTDPMVWRRLPSSVRVIEEICSRMDMRETGVLVPRDYRIALLTVCIPDWVPSSTVELCAQTSTSQFHQFWL